MINLFYKIICEEMAKNGNPDAKTIYKALRYSIIINWAITQRQKRIKVIKPQRYTI